jgi:hypothetical protein
MDAGSIKVCPRCKGAWAGNIMRCVSCGAAMPDPEPEQEFLKIDRREQK